MATKAATKPTNGHATAADVAASLDPIPIRPAVAQRIMARQDEVEQADRALRDAIAARDDMVQLAQEIEGPPEGWIITRTGAGDLVFAPPRPAAPTA